MNNAGVEMDPEHDRAGIFGHNFNRNLSSSRHYCIPIDKTERKFQLKLSVL